MTNGAMPPRLKAWFGADGALRNGAPEEALEALKQLEESEAPGLRLSQELGPWLEAPAPATERKQLRREYELKVQSGEWPAHETNVPLFPYQREGMLHLAFTERALLADEMGLGKTIQAIAACALLHRLGQAAACWSSRPASLKTEWEEQIQKLHRPAVPACRSAASMIGGGSRRAYWPTGACPRRSSPLSITSRCSPTRWT